MNIAQLYDQSRDESLTAAERDLARRQADAAVHNECFHTGPAPFEQELRKAQREVFCSPCGEDREYCGHPESFGADDPALRRCERHGGRSQTECDVFEAAEAEQDADPEAVALGYDPASYDKAVRAVPAEFFPRDNPEPPF